MEAGSWRTRAALAYALLAGLLFSCWVDVEAPRPIPARPSAEPAGTSSPVMLPEHAANPPAAHERAAGQYPIGPIPDFAPMAGIVTHTELADFEPAAADLLTRLLGPHHYVEPAPDAAERTASGGPTGPISDDRFVWIRDYHPLWVRSRDGSLKLVRYLADTARRSTYLPPPVRAARPSASSRWKEASELEPVPSEILPLLHANGNLVTNGRLIFVTDLLLEENGGSQQSSYLLAAGFRPRTSAEVLQLLADAVERPVEDVVVLPRMPGEQTGHVDLFLLPLDEQTVVVPELRAEALTNDLMTDGAEALSFDIQAFLDHVTSILRDLGLTVARLPMLPPIAIHSDDGLGPDVVIVSPANALLVPVRGMRVVLLPRFELQSFPPEFRRADEQYRREWSELFRTHRWLPVTVEATHLALNQGLLRCASHPIPQDAGPPERRVTTLE
ncbi:MAG: hypothetical protein JRI23_23985 [Deltaproteobacteria bacterium]|jgi:hypothetical protein|nr:hypothetical protein [Deltaproteobacteria bacterium]MBW2535053.1 hypothetical protein [Deltaproteobacteria bacterium]